MSHANGYVSQSKQFQGLKTILKDEAFALMVLANVTIFFGKLISLLIFRRQKDFHI